MFKLKYCSLIIIFLCSLQSIAHSNSDKIIFGFLPYFSATKLIELHSPMVEFIQTEIGQKITMISAPDFKEFQKRTKNGEYDLIYTAPHMARLAELESNYQWVFMSTHRGRPIFLTKKNSGIISLKNMENRKISLPPPKAINHHVALKALAQIGLVENKNIQVVVTPSHSSALLSLLENEVDMAVMGNAPWKSYKEEYKDRIKVVSTSADFPGFLVMANPKVSKSLVIKIKNAAVKLNNTEHGRKYFKSTGLESFAPINQETMQELDPYVKAIFWN